MQKVIKRFMAIKIGEYVTHFRALPTDHWTDITGDDGVPAVVNEHRAYPNTYWSDPHWEWLVIVTEPEFNEHGEAAL